MSDQTEGVFNTFPDVSTEDLGQQAITLKAQLWQVIGELTRRPDMPAKTPVEVEDALNAAVAEVLFFGFVSGQFDSEHELLQVIIDGGGSLKGTALDAVATDTVVQNGEHVLSADCSCGPVVESFAGSEVSAR